MNKKDQHISEAVEEALNLASRIGEVPSNPFLWAKIEGKMSREKADRPRIRWQLAAALVILLLNFSALGWNYQQQSQRVEVREIQSIWNDLELDASTTFVVPENQNQR